MNRWSTVLVIATYSNLLSSLTNSSLGSAAGITPLASSSGTKNGFVVNLRANRDTIIQVIFKFRHKENLVVTGIFYVLQEKHEIDVGALDTSEKIAQRFSTQLAHLYIRSVLGRVA